MSKPTASQPLSWLKLHIARHHLKQGGIIAYPTEAVYGLGCDPLNEKAIDNLAALKHRSLDKGFILIAADFHQIEAYVDISSDTVRNRVLSSWPGPTTWVLPCKPWVPDWLKGKGNTIAVRVTQHSIVAALSRIFGAPIISTSANKSGYKPAGTALEVRKYFQHKDLLIVHGPTGNQSSVTPIFDALSGFRIR